MKSQATIFDDVSVEFDAGADKLLINKIRKPFKPTVTRGVAEVYSEVERVFADVKTLLPYTELELINSTERLQAYMKNIQRVGYIAIDTEADGKNAMLDRIAGLCIYTKGEHPAYIPINHDYYEHNIPVEVASAFMKAIKRDGIKVIMHNASFDVHMIERNLGVRLPVYFDTMIAGRMLNENVTNGLKDLYSRHIATSRKSATFGELFGGIKFTALDPERVYPYAAMDSIMTYEVWEFQLQYLDPNNPKCAAADLVDMSKLFWDIEMPLIDITIDMEHRGMSIDLDYVKDLEKKYRTLEEDFADKATKALTAMESKWSPNLSSEKLSKLSNPVNIKSSTQLSLILFDGLKLQIKKGVLKKGEDSGTGVDAIKYLQEAYPEYNELFTALLGFRKVNKLMSTYIIALPKLINPETNRVHGEWNTLGAKTGRFSSKNPNLQNIPSRNKDIRPMFVPKTGYKFVGADYS